MNEFEPRPLDLERLRLTGTCFAGRVDAGTRSMLEARRDVGTGTARGIARGPWSSLRPRLAPRSLRTAERGPL
jgi:hypothetical protein